MMLATYCHAPATSGAPSKAAVQGVRESLYASAFNALRHGDSAGAERYFGLMAAVGPFDERVWLGLGVIREQRGDWVKAAGLYGLARSVNPGSLFGRLGGARVAIRQGRLQRAEVLLDQAESLTEDPVVCSAISQLRRAL